MLTSQYSAHPDWVRDHRLEIVNHQQEMAKQQQEMAKHQREMTKHQREMANLAASSNRRPRAMFAPFLSDTGMCSCSFTKYTPQ